MSRGWPWFEDPNPDWDWSSLVNSLFQSLAMTSSPEIWSFALDRVPDPLAWFRNYYDLESECFGSETNRQTRLTLLTSLLYSKVGAEHPFWKSFPSRFFPNHFITRNDLFMLRHCAKLGLEFQPELLVRALESNDFERQAILTQQMFGLTVTVELHNLVRVRLNDHTWTWPLDCQLDLIARDAQILMINPSEDVGIGYGNDRKEDHLFVTTSWPCLELLVFHLDRLTKGIDQLINIQRGLDLFRAYLPRSLLK